jgi:3-oxoacyl-[acyl-carrier protein] reductase
MDIPPPNRLLDFHGKTVAITGASAGIGAGIASRFAKAGANLVVNYRRNEGGARSVAQEIESLGARVVVVHADVAAGHEGIRVE